MRTEEVTESVRAMPTSALIEVRGLRVERGGRPVIDGLTLELAAGMTLLLGDNGAGKSTLLLSLLGLIPSAGHRILFAQPCPRSGLASSVAARVAFLPERFLPPWHLSGWECLEWALALRGETVDVAAAQALAERLHLDASALQRPARAFSKGMTQKLGLMTVLLSQAPLLILDEPASGLDPTSRIALLGELSAAVRAGRSFLLSTHALGDVLWLEESCRPHRVRLLLMRAGRLIADDFADAVAPGGDWHALQQWYRKEAHRS